MEGAEGRWEQGLGGEEEGRTAVRFRKEGGREKRRGGGKNHKAVSRAL